MPERDHCPFELTAPVGQLVDACGRRRRELASPDHPGTLELAETLGENVGTRVRESPAQVGVALRDKEQLADDEQCPALSDEVEGLRDRAAVAVCPHRRHARTIPESPLKDVIAIFLGL